MELCRSAGLLLLEIASPTGQPTACQFRFDTARDAVKLIQYLEEGGFCEGPVDYVFTNPVVHESSRFLIVRNYQDTTETLKGIIKGQGNVALHLIQAETRAGKRRVDAYLGFKDISRAVAAKVALEKAEFTGKDAASIRFVLQEIYYSATEQPRPNYTEEQLKKPPVLDRSDTPGLPAIPRGPYPTIFLGNVPVELLQDKEAVIKRFSVYGPLNEVRIPMEDGKARGMVYLEFSRQEDADVLHHDLVTAPLFLYGRKIRVDYAENKSRSKAAFSVPQQSLNSRSVYIDGILPEVGARRLDLYRTLRSFGEVVDMRAMRINGEITQVFIDYLDPEGASALIAAANSGELQSLGPDIITAPASHMKSPLWLNMDYEPTDVLRVWNVPVRALWSDDMLREAFDFNGGLIHVRRLRHEGWPLGVAYLHYKNVEAAKEVLEWVRSDPEKPVTFFGREVRMHFSNERPPKEMRDSEVQGRGRVRDAGWGSKRGTPSSSEGLKPSGTGSERDSRRNGLDSWGQTGGRLPTISNMIE